jgi:hypothetical protein
MVYFIVQQVREQPNLAAAKTMILQAFTPQHAVTWTIVLVLMLLNWSIEAYKWKVLMNCLEPISFYRAVRAVFTGQAVAFTTINRLGEPAGRALFLSEGNRIRGAVLSVMGGLAQLLVTIAAGWLGLIFLQLFQPQLTIFSGAISGAWLKLLNLLLVGVIFLLALLYFNPTAMVNWLLTFRFFQKISFFLQKLTALAPPILTTILLLSLIRFVIYTSQYLLLLNLFGVEVGWSTGAALVSLMLMVLALIPSIALAELGFRGQISIWLLGLVSVNYAGIVATAAGIWLVNLIIPALAGSLLILGVRIFSKSSAGGPMKKMLLFGFIFLSVSFSPRQDEFCGGIRNFAFRDGEVVNYNVYYTVIGIYVHAGNASFSVKAINHQQRPAYQFVSTGTSNSGYDWIFKVRDRYESVVDTGTLQPLQFIRDIQEGSFKKYEFITFNHQTHTATTTEKTYTIPNCIQDVLSTIYYARNINFNKYQPGDKIPFAMFLDNEVFNLYIKYLGKEVIKTKYGTFNAIKFRPLLVKGTLFEGGEKMTVWVSDDNNHIPLRVESPIVVGSIKADMMGYSNLRYPLSSLINLRD